MVTLRKLSQLFFFMLAVYLLIVHNSLIFKFDPLHFLTTSIAGRQIVVTMLWSIILLGLTLVFGRYFCSWICPVGTILDVFKMPSAHNTKFLFFTRWKYYILIIIGITAVFGLQLSWILDPFSLLHRVLGLIPWNKTAIVVPPEQSLLFSIHSARIIVTILFVSILILNLFNKRVWCKTFCPLGALYGTVSRYSLLNRKVNDRCTACKKCEKTCPMNTIDSEKFYSKKSECTLCLNCQKICPVDAIDFVFGEKHSPEFSLSRRYWLTSFVTGIAMVPLFRLIKTTREKDFLRPPGVLNEQEFLAKCVRCGKCMEVCPTQGLLPAILDSKLEGFYTPHLVPRIGYCAYPCNQCGQVCPSEAIPALSVTEKQKFPIGIAAINYDKCIRCLTCEEMCPIPEKAIHIREENFSPALSLIKAVIITKGGKKFVKTPYVIPDLCIGCGICENKCPVSGTAAIRVYSTKV